MSIGKGYGMTIETTDVVLAEIRRLLSAGELVEATALANWLEVR